MIQPAEEDLIHPCVTKESLETETELKTYPMAWCALALVVLFRTAVAIFGNTFSPIPTIVAEYLHVSLSEINWLYTIMSLVYILVSFGTSWLYETVGVKWSYSYQLKYYDCRKSYALLSLAINNRLFYYQIIMVASICTICTVPFIFMPSKPKTPASLPPVKMIDPNNGKEVKQSLIQGTLTLLKNPQFLIILFVHGINVGLSIAWGGLMNQAISPYGYTNADAGNIAAIGIVGGSVGCFIAGPILDRTKQHKILLKLVSPIVFSTYLAFIFISIQNPFARLYKTNPFCFTSAYPITDSIPTSLLWQLGQVVGSPLVIVMDRFRDPQGTPKNNMVMALVFQAGLASVLMLLSLIFNGPMARTEAFEQAKKNQEKVLTFDTYSNLVCPDNESSETIMAEGRHHSKRNR
ncbi:hypothetical protein BY458DRAFT_440986 [Sporodiniella umbellata]|nr:hypothetical protein BY458DRAFT_440986 [Sporodiniella umbellata]